MLWIKRVSLTDSVKARKLNKGQFLLTKREIKHWEVCRQTGRKDKKVLTVRLTGT